MRFGVVAFLVALAGFAAGGCDQVLAIQDHALARDAGADSGKESGASDGGDGGCVPCAFGTARLNNCCLH